MIWEGLKSELILLDFEADSSTEVFEKLGRTLIKEGYCKETYIDALIEREKDFPTGINMGGIGIAIPHTDKRHVNHGGVAIGVLKKSVDFYQMGTTDEKVEAKLIFMLAVDDPKEHLTFLQRILQVLQDQKVLEKVKNVTSKEELIKIIRDKESELEKGAVLCQQ